MKNLFITSVSAIALSIGASAAFANDSNIDQIGATNIATVDQTGGNEGASTIDQDGAQNLAEVTQSENPVGSVGASVAANDATINQIGSNARARIEQHSDNPGGASNMASISQNSNGLAQGPDGVPSGYSMNGRIVQAGSGNSSSIVQSGNPNQAPGNGLGSGVTARNDQTGVDNQSEILQDVFAQDANPFTDANVDQTGAGNVSGVRQRGSAALVNVSQTGAFNTSDVNQGANREMTADVVQTGVDHNSTINQTARTVTASVNQDGTNQTSMITQGAQSRESTATVVQSTLDNTSTITQTNTSADAFVTQSGTGGVSTITQSDGANAYALLTQSGMENVSTMSQTGDDHQSIVLQSSDYNESTVTQSGTAGANFANVSQTITSGNISSVVQTGAGNTATVMQ